MAVYQQPGFKHGLFDCCDNCSDCLLAYLCPNCYAFCAAQDADEGCVCSLLNCFFYPLFLCCLRSSARHKRGIEGGCCGDVLASYCCPCCTVIQIRREFNE